MATTPPVALVTGASRGIGRRLCIDLAREGWDVVCVARSTAQQPGRLPGTLEETAREVEAAGRRAMAVPLDVRDDEAIAKLADRVYESWGRCDLLVNNAAISPPGAALQEPLRRWRLAVDVNLNGPFFLSYHFAPRMAEAGGGRVVNISSVVAVTPEFGRPSYTATKRALEGLTEALAFELADQVAFNCVRLEVPVLTEGFAATLPSDSPLPFEDPVIMSDAILWLARQPIDYTGNVLTIAALRELGAVRPVTQAVRT